MPAEDYAHCPSCESKLGLPDLEALAKRRGGFLARLLRPFRKPART